ncbi:MAG: tripartite tricarboxylate transporter substrate binding protein [Rhodocyclaceae bacterium]|nr:tripartite tricarboxylate transporter substrate binding protein [Rhodocyclaceae bacterium]MCE2981362.1 tripartite tricarboxylate transporter substrate binding protein [Betaproteobacteria bacterium]MCA3089892.1 tripartite tricarboxylate transporter substrate binding protein [Rhodocyclaceae bacterium]MCA3093540.1 tripartite tricarboxylate transporter substrate binding protein [Rhodocyclaceae bacterium]MCA3096357.1 tripartite tricarboxylate transporter substrate binding protein [Rhodocyclaceae 
MDSLMRSTGRWSSALALGGLVLAVAPMQATAQAFPSKPIRWVAPFAPGGTSDIVARAVAQRLSATIGQQVVIDNRAGAGGNIAADLVVRAPADGYTLLTGFPGLAINPSLYAKLTYDPLKDLAPVTLMTSAPLVLVTSPAIAVKTVKELVSLALAQPGTLNFCSAGNGTSSHLAGELFKSMAKIDIVHVPYKGSVECMADLMGGRISLMVNPLPEMLPMIKSNKLRGMAVSSLQRAPSVPELPAVTDAGVKGYEVSTWNGVMVPTGTPGPVISRLHAEISGLLKGELRKQLEEQALTVIANTPEEFGAFLRAETTKWAAVVKASGARIQ